MGAPEHGCISSAGACGGGRRDALSSRSMRLPTLVRALLAVTPLASVGCNLLFPAPTPMRTVSRVADASHRSRCLVVFLPGFGDDENVFVDHGFVDALRARGMAVDSISAGATFGYYSRRTVVARLREDVLAPARAKGYEQIWVVGVSMGGLGSLLLSKDQEPGISGVYLLAPYLGDKGLLEEIDRAGGVAQWEPGNVSPDDYQRDLWRYIKRVTQNPQGPPSLYLGAGDEDKLGYGHRVLAAALPREHVFSTPGKHDWGPWSLLWADFLDHSELGARCAQ
jgi:pimeloyl-ACP methyl ester carboxylesterase